MSALGSTPNHKPLKYRCSIKISSCIRHFYLRLNLVSLLPTWSQYLFTLQSIHLLFEPQMNQHNGSFDAGGACAVCDAMASVSSTRASWNRVEKPRNACVSKNGAPVPRVFGGFHDRFILHDSNRPYFLPHDALKPCQDPPLHQSYCQLWAHQHRPSSEFFFFDPILTRLTDGFGV